MKLLGPGLKFLDSANIIAYSEGQMLTLDGSSKHVGGNVPSGEYLLAGASRPENG